MVGLPWIETIDKPYSKEQLERLDALFKELENFRESPAIRKYTAKKAIELKG